MKKKIIVVIGMHRSGTSALTRALEVLNVHLGDNLMKPIADVNDKGFFEDLDINKFNDYLLKKMNCNWCSCNIPQKNQLDFLNNTNDIEAAIELLNLKINGTHLFGFKDPRVSVLLPFWQNIFELCNLDPYYLISIRNPLSVAKSLEKRDKLTLEKGLFLWTEYMLAGIENTTNNNRIFVHYENLMANPLDQIQNIANEFNLEINTTQLNTYVNDFLDSNLQHSKLTLDDLEQNINFNINKSTYELYKYYLKTTHLYNLTTLPLFEIKNIFENDLNVYLKEFQYQDYLLFKINELETIQNNILIELKNTGENRDNILVELKNTGIDRDKILGELKEHINMVNSKIEDNNKLLNQIKICSNEIESKTLEINNIKNSLSWKITLPLRFIKNKTAKFLQ